MSTTSSDEALQVLSDGLKEFPQHTPPDALYRFFRPTSLSALQNGFLSLTPPKYFNDPFEQWAGINVTAPAQTAVLRSLTAPQGIFRKTIQQEKPSALTEEPNYVSKLEAAVREHPEWADDHLRAIIDAVYTTMSSATGVCCFSAFCHEQFRGPSGIHHWAMYAHRHEGFCVGYNGQHSFFVEIAKSKWLFPVEYRAERLIVPLEYFDEWNNAKLWRTIREWSAMKSAEAWGHEREWRLMFMVGGPLAGSWHIRQKDDQGQDREYLRLWSDTDSNESKAAGAAAIKRVTLGVRASAELKADVQKILSEPHLSHVELWDSRPSRSEFALDLKRIK